MKLKKTPRYLALTLLTTGASLILGFLSFGGIMALAPVLPLAVGAFALSVAYEGEIYLQNITGALHKLFKYNHLQRQLANQYLLTNFPNVSDDDCPQFFKDYKAQLHLFHQFGHKSLTKESKTQKYHVEKTLRDMEKWFAEQLFSNKKSGSQPNSPYAEELRLWLVGHQQTEWQTLYNKRKNIFTGVKIFSALSALFMGLGTTYLLGEALAAIPLFTALSLATSPIFIVPMAAIAGIAYGLLTYNAITDMISNDTLRKWYHKIRDDLSKGINLRSLFIATSAVLLVGLAIALTICTAGTWWTVAKNARPLFEWMKKMPSFIMGIINPIINGLSSIVFNLQNTSESLEIIDEATRKKGNVFTRMFQSIKNGFQGLYERENWLQILNPFRLIITLTIVPLRIVLFLGHLVSIGVTADRVPGISQVFSALLGIISEGFEDLHYFVGHEHTHTCEHSSGDAVHDHTQALLKERLGNTHTHNHDLDLPTRIIKIIASPLYLLAALWDYAFSRKNQGEASKHDHVHDHDHCPGHGHGHEHDHAIEHSNAHKQNRRQPLSFARAWNKQNGIPEEETVALKSTIPTSSDWKVEQAVYRIERFKEKHLEKAKVGCAIARQKTVALTTLQEDLRNLDTTEAEQPITIRLNAEKENPVYNLHRFFDNGKTQTAAFIEELPQRIASMG